MDLAHRAESLEGVASPAICKHRSATNFSAPRNAASRSIRTSSWRVSSKQVGRRPRSRAPNGGASIPKGLAHSVRESGSLVRYTTFRAMQQCARFALERLPGRWSWDNPPIRPVLISGLAYTSVRQRELLSGTPSCESTRPLVSSGRESHWRLPRCCNLGTIHAGVPFRMQDCADPRSAQPRQTSLPTAQMVTLQYCPNEQSCSILKSSP